eukprot:TRINITY_DN48333_c0_g1_i1.p1 TRINITY_DN48333_c0_g1~~TRINITY_DN48333_c0_g1_i1.p1  ORF type:complete len:838 (+),score=87.06 TRINITY_DN48333_c0_g1_i1:116-2515(+)
MYPPHLPPIHLLCAPRSSNPPVTMNEFYVSQHVKGNLIHHDFFVQQFRVFHMAVVVADLQPTLFRLEIDTRDRPVILRSSKSVLVPSTHSLSPRFLVIPLSSTSAALIDLHKSHIMFFDFDTETMIDCVTEFRSFSATAIIPDLLLVKASTRSFANDSFLVHPHPDHSSSIQPLQILSRFQSSFGSGKYTVFAVYKHLAICAKAGFTLTKWSLWDIKARTKMRKFVLSDITSPSQIGKVTFNTTWLVICVLSFTPALRVYDFRSFRLQKFINMTPWNIISDPRIKIYPSMKISNNLLLYYSLDCLGIIDLSEGSLVWRVPCAAYNINILPNATLSVSVSSGLITYALPTEVQLLLIRNMSKEETIIHDSCTPLQSALISVLKGCSSPAGHCRSLINKQNCGASVEEWNAAHQLLTLAVVDGTLKASDQVDGKLYYWKDQLYCTAPDLSIYNDEDKNLIFKCLRDAHHLGLIDTPDGYIQGIHLMRTIGEEIVAIKRASLLLLSRVISIEATVEDLRTAFQRYRENQIISHLVGIALELIPMAGGALSKAIVAGVGIAENLSAGDIIEYTLSSAATILEDVNFKTLPRTKQDGIDGVFAEYGYTKEEVRILLFTKGKGIGQPTELSDVQIADEKQNREVDRKKAAKHEGPGAFKAAVSYSNDADAEFQVQKMVVSEAGLQPRKETIAMPVSNSNNTLESRFNLQQRSPSFKIEELAESCTAHMLGSVYDEEIRLCVVSCLLEFMEKACISPDSLKYGSKSDLEKLKIAISDSLEQKLGDKMKIGYTFKLKQFLEDYVNQS